MKPSEWLTTIESILKVLEKLGSGYTIIVSSEEVKSLNQEAKIQVLLKGINE